MGMTHNFQTWHCSLKDATRIIAMVRVWSHFCQMIGNHVWNTAQRQCGNKYHNFVSVPVCVCVCFYFLNLIVCLSSVSFLSFLQNALWQIILRAILQTALRRKLTIPVADALFLGMLASVNLFQCCPVTALHKHQTASTPGTNRDADFCLINKLPINSSLIYI